MTTKTKSRFAAALAAILLAAATAHAEPQQSFEVTVTGSGAPVLFIPGLACDGSVWDETVSRYSSDFECHVFTLAGFGASNLPAVDENVPFLEKTKAELIAYIEAKNLRTPVIVGHSLGGFVALLAAADKPDLASQLVIVDSLPFLPAAMNPSATVESMQSQAGAQRSMMAQGGQSRNATRGMLNMMVTDPTDIERALEMSMKSNPKAVAQAMYELNTTDLRQTVSQIETPTLVLGAWIAYEQFGSTKESTSDVFNSQYAAHPEYRLAMSDRGKHFIMWDDPEFFYAHLDSILSATDLENGKN